MKQKVFTFNSFTFDGINYLQKKRFVIGTIRVPLSANILMSKFEKKKLCILT